MTHHELSSLEAGELHGSLFAAAFGFAAPGSAFPLRYFGITEVVVGSLDVGVAGTLDEWEAIAPADRALEIPTGACLYRVRFGWCDDAGNIQLARLVQRFSTATAEPRAMDSQQSPRRSPLHLHGTPDVRSISVSRQAADRWDRLVLHGFVANQLVAYLTRRSASRS